MPDRTPIRDRARGRWQEILPALGVDANALRNKHGPCPVCGGKDRFRFDDKDGLGTWICGQSHGTETSKASVGSAGNGLALVMDLKRLEFREAVRLVESIIGLGRTDPPASTANRLTPGTAGSDVRAKLAAAGELWRASRRVEAGDPVALYLSKRLGMSSAPGIIRTLLDAEHTPSGTRHPAMLAKVVDMHGDTLGVHRTFLTTDGRKADIDPVRMALGSLPDGCAVRLAEHGRVLGIAEGIETALAASILHGIPVWAALNAGRLKVWSPPEGVTEVVVFGDNDGNCVGQEAAYALGARLNQSIIAQVAIPLAVDTDWADVLAAQRRESVAPTIFEA